DPRSAAIELRRTVRHCVRSWAACHPGLALRLSGGLDSSIVLSCFGGSADSTRELPLCITFYGTNAGADPRRWARLAAQHIGCDIIEVPVNATDISLEAVQSAGPTPAPAML